MPICDKCDKEVIKTFKGGGLQLCHKCTHDLGLLHIHRDENGVPDPTVDGSTHYLDGFSPKEEIKTHLEAFKERTG